MLRFVCFARVWLISFASSSRLIVICRKAQQNRRNDNKSVNKMSRSNSKDAVFDAMQSMPDDRLLINQL